MSIGTANQECLRRIHESTAVLVDVRLARDVIPGMGDRTVLHAGPPITWDRMCGPMRGAISGACVFEGWVKTPEEGMELAASGALTFDSCHNHRSVGPMSGIITPSMAVHVIRNDKFGIETYANLYEGIGKVLRHGANDQAVIDRLRWMHDEMAPVLTEAVRRSGGIDIKSLVAEALQMGDEMHNRNRACSSRFILALVPHMVAIGKGDLEKIITFMDSSSHICLNSVMASCKAMLDAGHGIADSTIVTAMARNGTDFGIRVSGLGDLEKIITFMDSSSHVCLNSVMASCKAMLDAGHGVADSTIVTAMARNGTDFGIRVSGLGDRWFTAPSPMVDGVYFPGYGPEDANPDLGDSAITETAGLGSLAMAGAPAVVQYVGGTAKFAIETTQRMYEITAGEHETFRIPNLNFRGTPIGIDIRRVVETGITPVINTGIAHRKAGIGQIGAGLTAAPLECFVKALEAFAETRGVTA